MQASSMCTVWPVHVQTRQKYSTQQYILVLLVPLGSRMAGKSLHSRSVLHQALGDCENAAGKHALDAGLGASRAPAKSRTTRRICRINDTQQQAFIGQNWMHILPNFLNTIQVLSVACANCAADSTSCASFTRPTGANS